MHRLSQIFTCVAILLWRKTPEFTFKKNFLTCNRRLAEYVEGVNNSLA